MTEKMTVQVSVEDWNGYGGLQSALSDAIEKMKDGRMIRRVTALMSELEEAHDDYKRRHKVVEDIKSDVSELQDKIERL